MSSKLALRLGWEIGMGDWDDKNDDGNKTKIFVEHAAVEYISDLKLAISR